MSNGIRQNRGEWSEAYAFLKLISDRMVYAGDAELAPIAGREYPVVRIIHLADSDKDRRIAELARKNVNIILPDGQVCCNVPYEVFGREAKALLYAILAGGSTPAFEVPQTEKFFETLGIQKLKADGGKKSDITIVVHDQMTACDQPLEFSIKSFLGSPPTLLNASHSSNLIYEISRARLGVMEMKAFNDSREQVTQKVASLHHGHTLKFRGCENKMLECNLMTIDSMLPDILGELLLLHYTRGERCISALVEMLKETNPIGFHMGLGHEYYPAKIKKFLVAAALGMTPAQYWDGRYDVTGGSLIVKQSGELVLYHVYNWNDFEDFLLRSTEIDRPSQKRHGYGSVYEENGKQRIRLNFQIRFQSPKRNG